MNVRKIFQVPGDTLYGALALLLLRLVAGLAFVFHGWPKIQSPFGWMGPDGFAPGFFQALAALAEFGGGVAWMLGLLTPLAAVGIAITMVVAFSFHAFMMGDPFVSYTGEGMSSPAAVYFCIAVVFLALGPGRFSLDRLIFGTRENAAEGGGELQPE